MTKEELPVGAPVGWRPVAAPQRRPLAGRHVRLEPVDPARHTGDLHALSVGAPRLWTYLGYGPFADAAAFRQWFESCVPQQDPLFFAVIDAATGRASGMVSYLRIAPATGVIEIGHIWFAPALQRTRQATEAIFLLMRHAFDDLGYRRLEWKCDSLNAASRRAAARFGFTFEGVFRQHMIVKGRNRDTAWFAILDGEWPAIRAGFERWLDDANFDAAGRQRAPLKTREAAGT